MMSRSLELTRSGISQANHYHLKVWRLRVDVTAVDGDMDRNVFLWRQNDPDPDTAKLVYEFVTVATVADMSEYPEGGPNPDTDHPYFRTDFFEIDVTSQSEYNEAWRVIRTAVDELVAALEAADDLEPQEVFRIGKTPVTGD